MSQERDHRSVLTPKAARGLAGPVFALAVASIWLLLFAADETASMTGEEASDA